MGLRKDTLFNNQIKMITTLARIIKYGFQNFVRNGWLSVATTVIMVIVLIVFNTLIIFKFLTDAAVSSIKNKIDISAYFKNNIVEDEILKIGRALESLAEVKNVEYISRDQALEIFKLKHQNEEVISTALQELETNPLLASLNIKAKNPEDYKKIASYLENSNFINSIEKITYTQNQLIINRLASIIDSIENFGLAIVLILALVATLVTFNTIRLAIYSNRQELNIMRLVGASNKFINGPYIVTGIIYGIIAAILSLVIISPLIGAISPYIQVFIPEINLKAYFYSNFTQFLNYQLILGILLGSISAVIAVRRYLKI